MVFRMNCKLAGRARSKTKDNVEHVATDGRRLTRVHGLQELDLVSSAQKRTQKVDLLRIEMTANVRSCKQVRRPGTVRTKN
jgi:hypothetical protein